MASKNPFGQVSLSKSDPANTAEKGKYEEFDEEADTNHTRPTTDKRDLEKTAVVEGEKSHGTISGKLPAEKNYLFAVIAFGISIFMSIHLCFDIYDIVIEPEIFTLFFTGNIGFILVGLAFAKGPQDFVELMFDEEHRLKSGFLLLSMLFSLFIGVIMGSYILSIVGCFLQFFICT